MNGLEMEMEMVEISEMEMEMEMAEKSGNGRTLYAGVKASVQEEDDVFDVESIVWHGRAADVARTFQDHPQASNGSLKQYVDEATVYQASFHVVLVRWLGYDEDADTFEVQDAFDDNSLFEKYVSENCDALSRYLMPTEETMRDVRDRLAIGRSEVEKYIGPLEAAARDITKKFPQGQKADEELQACYQTMQTLCMNPANNIEWRLVYMLLDAGSPGLTADCDLRTFVRALFYVGKGTEERPFDHLKEAKDHLLKPKLEPNPPKRHYMLEHECEPKVTA
ncbi:hypothetical protein AAVH_15684 [Aphelenchoides avenae]|nr:hypothetical protein AAVH_15684 [Aphelenchus avenae]